MKNTVLFILLTMLFSCKENPKMNGSESSIDSINIHQLKIVNATDPICNMTVKEHLSDTAMINGEIWGFCSTVCKEKYVSLKK